MNEALGELLADRYTIERILGRGGMAVVHLAEERKRDVASFVHQEFPSEVRLPPDLDTNDISRLDVDLALERVRGGLRLLRCRGLRTRGQCANQNGGGGEETDEGSMYGSMHARITHV